MLRKYQRQKPRGSGLISLNNQSIDISIVERYATISYLFDFENTNEYGSNELNFEITIDPGAFISSFTADIDGELFIGETKERKAAKKQYVVAKSKNENAILISQVNKDIPNLFRIQTNIDAESEVSLKITIEQYLKKKFNFNQLNVEIIRDFNTSTICPNYAHILLNVSIRDTRGIYEVTLPSHLDMLQMDEMTMDKNNEFYHMKGKLMHKKSSITEFMLKYKVKGEQNESSMLYHKQSRTFCHVISDIITDSLLDDKDACEGHDDAIQGELLIPRRVAFIIDQSYSMHGVKWTKTISATVQALNQLRPNHDRYNIIFFDQNMKQYTHDKMILATQQNIDQAIAFVQKETLGGATDINSPLLRAIELIKNDIKLLNDVSTKDSCNFYMNQMILITDGEPNNGVTNTSQILLNVAHANTLKGLDAYSNKISIFSFGVGTDRNDSSWTTDLNHSFLKILSVNNEGIYKRIKETNCDTQLAQHYHVLSTPVLTNIDIKYDTHCVNNLTNTSFNALFHGNDLIIGGQCADDKPLDSVEVIISAITGKTIKQNDEYITKPIHIKKRITMDIPQDNDTEDEEKENHENNIERIWAYLKLQQFAKQKLIHNDMIEMDDEEEKERDALPMLLAMKYKFVTPWTSMIVVKEKEGNQEKKKKKKQSEMSQDERAFDYVGADPNAALSDGTYYHMVDLTQNPIHSRSASQSDAPQVATVFSQTEPLGTKEIRSGVDQSDQKEREMDLDKCDELMEDINEAMDQVNEMNEAMNQPLGTMMNDDEFLVEFEESEESSDVGVPVLTGSMLTFMPAMGTFSACAVGSVDTCHVDEEFTEEVPKDTLVDKTGSMLAAKDMFAGFTYNETGDNQQQGGSTEYVVPLPNRRPNVALMGCIRKEVSFSEDDDDDSEDEDDDRARPPSRRSVRRPPKGQPQNDEDDTKEAEKERKIFEAYNDEDIRITFECIASSKASGFCEILATFSNKSTEQIRDFKFTVKVDAHINLTIKSANGTKLLASSQNSITQLFELINTKYGEQPFVIDFEVAFTKDSTQIILKSSVKIPDGFV